jgi:endogenous inhibitor of DNA gyrase (YacG/DUF329 family)
MIKVTCPICQRTMQGQRPQEWPQWPFCSPRCRLIDLGRWLGEDYRVPGEDTTSLDDSEVNDPSKPAVPSAVPHREEA